MVGSKDTALVTGGATRLGKAISIKLAESGYNIAIQYRSSETEAKKTVDEIKSTTDSDVVIFQADLSSADSCGKLINEVVSHFGGIDLLVNNASIFENIPIEKVDAKAIEENHAIHVTAPAILSLHAAKHMGDIGHIVNMIDIFADYAKPGFLPYTLSKAGLKSLTKQLAYELAPKNILVNAVSPGAILAPSSGEESETKEAIIEMIPLKRYGDLSDITETVLFLAKSKYITGQIISVDGGRSLRI